MDQSRNWDRNSANLTWKNTDNTEEWGKLPNQSHNDTEEWGKLLNQSHKNTEEWGKLLNQGHNNSYDYLNLDQHNINHSYTADLEKNSEVLYTLPTQRVPTRPVVELVSMEIFDIIDDLKDRFVWKADWLDYGIGTDSVAWWEDSDDDCPEGQKIERQ